MRGIIEQSYPKEIDPILTVFCWCYNDVNFIRTAVESILAQKTNFKVEIILYDDFSSDGSWQIIEEYGRKYPHLFNNFRNNFNNWSRGINVSIPLFTLPRGEFIALMHADDYWIEDYKLQCQVDILRKDSKLSFCYHKVKYLINNIYNGNYYDRPKKIRLTYNDLVFKHVVATSSIVYRKNKLDLTKEVYQKMHFNDIFLTLYLGNKGPVQYIDSSLGVYRKNVLSISHNPAQLCKGRLNLVKIYTDLFFIVYFRNKLFTFFQIIKNCIGLIADVVGRRV